MGSHLSPAGPLLFWGVLVCVYSRLFPRSSSVSDPSVVGSRSITSLEDRQTSVIHVCACCCVMLSLIRGEVQIHKCEIHTQWWYNSNLALVGLCYLLADLLLSQYTWQWVIRIIGRKHVIYDRWRCFHYNSWWDSHFHLTSSPLPTTTTTFQERWRTESKAKLHPSTILAWC